MGVYKYILLSILLTIPILGREYSIGITRFSGANVNEKHLDFITDRLELEISKKNIYKVIERRNVEKIMGEHKLQFSGNIDKSTAIELGKVVGLDNIVLGSVALFGSSYMTSVKMIDVETGQILSESIQNNKDGIESLIESTMKAIAEDITVCIGSENSDKYHRLNCKWAKKIKSKNMMKIPINEFEKKKYIKCKVCW